MALLWGKELSAFSVCLHLWLQAVRMRDRRALRCWGLLSFRDVFPVSLWELFPRASLLQWRWAQKVWKHLGFKHSVLVPTEDWVLPFLWGSLLSLPAWCHASTSLCCLWPV